MIQRIQSLYLLLVAVLTGLMLLMPLGTFLGGTEEMYLTAFGFSDAADGTPVLTAYGLAATVIAAALLPFVTIFLYKKRLLQFRLCVVETVLLAGVMLFEIYYIWGGARSLSTLAVSAWKLFRRLLPARFAHLHLPCAAGHPERYPSGEVARQDTVTPVRRQKRRHRRFAAPPFPFPAGSILHGREILLAHTAQRTYPIFGNILESGSGCHAAVGVPRCRVVYISAYVTNVLFHIRDCFN